MEPLDYLAAPGFPFTSKNIWGNGVLPDFPSTTLLIM